MRKGIKEFVKIVTETVSLQGPIYEFGALQVPGQEKFSDLRPFFAEKDYIGCDMQSGPGVDQILNLHHIELPNETASTVLALETLEHVEYVRKAIDEIHRILKPNGILIISSVMNFQIHSFPDDYWRFTPSAFRSLLKPFSTCVVETAGDEWFPHTVVGIGFKDSIPNEVVQQLHNRLSDWKKQWVEVTGSRWIRLLRLFVPEIFWKCFWRQKWKRRSKPRFTSR